jgi:CRISPR system Cascade subunit CasD
VDPVEGAPTLDAVTEALLEPARPLFIGRKPCLPSRPLFGGFSEGESSLAALLSVPLAQPDVRSSRGNSDRPVRLLWQDGEDAHNMDDVRINRRSMITDERNWVSGLHGGGRPVLEGTAPRERFGATRLQEEVQP